MMSPKKRILKLVLGVFICLVAANVVVNNCSAGKYYPNGYNQCLADSGGRSHIYSVYNYACRKAVEKSQNACATWLGPTTSSTSTTIYAASPTGTVPVNLWGMCTDRSNTSSLMWILNDGGSISCGGSCNFTRSGNWGSPSSKGATLNVAKFIQGAGIINGMYCRTIIIDRAHSDGESMGIDFSDICLSLGTPIPEPTPENPETLCKKWAPSGYTGANKWHGTTTVDIRIKNLSSRFGNTGYGTWNKGTIYAMPTDEVQWVECYFGGTPGTGQTEVSSINGSQKTYVVDPLSSEYCYSSSTGATKPRTFYGYYPSTNIGTTKQAVSYYQLYSKSPTWQNQWSIWGAGQVRRSGDSANGSWSFNVFVNKTDAKRNGYLTSEGQAGQTFTESGQTGAPQSVNIQRSSPTANVNRSYYYTMEENPNDPKSCDKTVTNPYYPWYSTEPTITKHYEKDGKECGYNKSLKVDHWDGRSCTNSYSKELRNAVVNYSPHNASASVKIPYNFTAYTGVSINSGEVYSGETVSVDSVWTMVAPKSNSVTKATYATQAPGARLKLYAYVTSDENGGNISSSTVTSNSNACSLLGGTAKQCLEFKSKGSFTLNGGGSLKGSFDRWGEMGGTYNAFDASAGDYMCFVSLVYPASSGSDTQMGTGGDGKWRYSDPSCVIIAKKPTFQVWGGSMYSVKSISTNIAQKRNIYKDYISNIGSRFKISGGTITRLGPWVEESLVIRDGTTTTVSSGAGTAYNSSLAAGAGSTSELCSGRANLSFSNDSRIVNELCKVNTVGKSGIDSGISDREQLIDYWLGTSGGAVNTNGGSYNLGTNNVGSEVKTATGVTVRYLNSSSDLDLYTTPSARIGQGVTYLIKADGNVNITGDIIYNSTGYGAFGSIPKVVIYAKNVNIQCNVSEVDAIIVTAVGGKVDTCSTASSDVDDAARSRKLKVFGIVITDNIDLKRTYGSAAWNTAISATPTDAEAAEVFDYDSSVLIWSEYMAGSAETDTLQTVYQNELAPRY